MKSVKGWFAGVLCLLSLAAVPGIFAAQEFILVGGTKAVIEDRQVILIDANSKRSIAPLGIYSIRGGSRAIYVTVDGIQVGEKPGGLR